MISRSRIDKCIRTIESICQSKQLTSYIIGYTSLSAGKKGDQYRANKFDHLVILENQLSQRDAITLENSIQKEIFHNKERIIFTKYHPEKAAKGTLYKSAGGVQPDPLNKNCAVYMAWWDRDWQ